MTDDDRNTGNSNINRQISLRNYDQNCGEKLLIALSWLLVIIFFPLAMFVCLHTMTEYERAVIFRLGRLRPGGPRGPGLIFILPCTDEVLRIDLRTASFNVPPQEILTKDSVTVSVDAVVYYHIFDPLLAVLRVERVRAATELLAQTTLRNVAGTKALTALLSEKDALSQAMSHILDHATDIWGVKVERVEIKEIYLPKQLQRAMAVEQEARREAKAKLSAAEGELQSANMLKEACDVMISNPIAFQLRYLQTLNTIASMGNRTIVFPLPMDLLKRVLGDSAEDKANPPPTPPPPPPPMDFLKHVLSDDAEDKSKPPLMLSPPALLPPLEPAPVMTANNTDRPELQDKSIATSLDELSIVTTSSSTHSEMSKHNFK